MSSWSARAVGALVIGGALIAWWLVAGPRALSGAELRSEAILVGSGALSLLLASMLQARLPRHPVTRVLTVYALATLAMTTVSTAEHVVGAEGALGAVPDRVAGAAWSLTLPMLAVLVTVFPDGALGRWRIVMWAQMGAIGVGVLAGGLLPDEHPVTFAARFGLVAVLVSGLAGAVRLVLQLRSAGGERREQLAWFVWTAAAIASLYVVGVVTAVLGVGVPGEDTLVLFLVAGGLPSALGFAVLRRRLYGLDVVVNRILVWGTVTLLLAGGYVAAVVAGTRLVAGTTPSLLPAVTAAVLVAGGLAPLRSQVQRVVDRLMYGDRDEPLRALRRLGVQLEATVAPEQVPTRIAEVVARATRCPWVRLELAAQGEEDAVVVESGERRGDAPPVVLDLSHAGSLLGRLLVQPRPGEDTLPARERQLLDDLGRQAGVGLYAARATTELLHSRARLVRGREAERARLRRDLHDGLSPALAGISLAAQAAASSVRADPQRAERLLTQMAAEAQASGETVRRLLADLRPAQLDELGLVAAIEQRVQSLESVLDVRMRAREVPVLPPAVEVAAYRIAVEALTNAARHAQARQVELTIAGHDRLEVQIADDGVGISNDNTAGVGLASMRERAEEVGGRLTIAHRPGGGTLVTAYLPLDGGPR